jgi:hypothetical protein
MTLSVCQHVTHHAAPLPLLCWSTSCPWPQQPVGIANTVQRYHESRPLVPHLTPFEARLEAKIAEEEMAAAALQAGGAAVLQAGGAAGSTKKQLFDAQ